MRAPIRADRADADFGRVDEEVAALIKGMLARGDKQSDIAACFMINGGRVAEINTRQRFAHVQETPVEELPPAGPYPSPFELWKSKRELWRTRVALEAAASAVQEALVAIHKAEQR